MTKSRVLFVDDDPNVLKGQRRMLWKMKNEWTMAFAESGAKALEFMEKGPADVLVSDMRMPGMDGAKLLEEVRDRYPSTIRIILSGYSDEEAVLRTTGPAHQYLAKPCDSETLTGTITRALRLRGLLRSEELRSLVSSLETLPTPPGILAELQAEMSSPEASAAKVAQIVSQDIAMTARVLKLTNSAFFSLPSEITKPLQAVQLLGLDTVHALVAMSGFFSTFEGNAGGAAMLEKLSRNSLAIGAAMKAIAKIEKFDKVTTDHARCAGWLCHVGALLLMANWSEKFETALAGAEGGDIATAEREIFGASHGEVGAYLLGLWGFPDPVVEAIAYHLEPSGYAGRDVNIVTCLHVAQAHIQNAEGMQVWPGSRLDSQYLDEVGATDRVGAWGDACAAVAAQDGTT